MRVGRPGEAHLEAELERLARRLAAVPAGGGDGEARAAAGSHGRAPELHSTSQ